MKSTINVRNVDEHTYRKFRGKCAELKIPTGQAMTEALEMWLKKYKDLEKINIAYIIE